MDPIIIASNQDTLVCSLHQVSSTPHYNSLQSVYPLTYITMFSSSVLSFLAAAGLATALPATRQTTAAWETLPATPALPDPINTSLSPINGAQLWLQKYNEAAGGTPILFDHGGLGYSAYFGDVIKQLVAAGRYVIAVDRRGHGRSTYASGDAFTYDMFANDIFAQMNEQKITKYDVVGWSDGAATTVAMLLNGTIAPTISRAFLFAGFMTAADTNATFTDTAIYSEFVSRCASEYATLQPSANFTDFATRVATMEGTLPTYTAAQLGVIDGSKVAIAYADHDEAVNLDVPAKLNAAISGSTLVKLTDVSHFAPVQDPDQFTKAVTSFLS